MQTITLSTFMDNMDFYITEAKLSKIFVYPTDTIYGIGGIITPQVIAKISAIKQRPDSKSYSLIAPSFTWIAEHFEDCDNIADTRIKHKSHAPDRGLTLLLKPKKEYIYMSELLSNNIYIGVRILDHPIQSWVSNLGQGFITTSANISGADPIYKLENLTDIQKSLIDHAVDEGEISGVGSRILYTHSGEVVRD